MKNLILKRKKKVSFPCKDGKRDYFYVKSTTKNKVLLRKIVGNVPEIIVITYDGKILTHYKGTLKTQTTFNPDEITLKELNEVRKK